MNVLVFCYPYWLLYIYVSYINTNYVCTFKPTFMSVIKDYIISVLNFYCASLSYTIIHVLKKNCGATQAQGHAQSLVSTMKYE